MNFRRLPYAPERRPPARLLVAVTAPAAHLNR